MKQPRYRGFVVGKDLVRGQDTWKVRAKDETSPLDGQKLKVASVWPGVTLARGMNILFEISDQNNAVNVAPRGVKTEGNPDMRNYIIGFTAILILLAGFVLAAVTNLHQREPLRSWIVETRAEWMLDRVRDLTFDQLVTDERVEAAVRGAAGAGEAFAWGGLRSASRETREHLFMDYQCQVFGWDVYDATAKEKCLPEGEALYHEGTARQEIAEELEIPLTVLGKILPAIRSELYRIGRTHLMSPTNLRSVYEEKLPVILETVADLQAEDAADVEAWRVTCAQVSTNEAATEEERKVCETPAEPHRVADFMATLEATINGFERFQSDEKVRALYTNYIELELAWDSARNKTRAAAEEYNAWLAKLRNTNPAEFSKEHYDLTTGSYLKPSSPFYAQALRERSEIDRLKLLDSGAYVLWSDARRELAASVDEFSYYLFAGRRHAEGGDELVEAYLDILRDLETRINR